MFVHFGSQTGYLYFTTSESSISQIINLMFLKYLDNFDDFQIWTVSNKNQK